MDEQVVRSYAEAHTRAVIAGDMKRGALDLLEECIPQAVEVMKRMPDNVVRADVELVGREGEEWRVRILYTGEGGACTRFESCWVERDGRPMVRDAKVTA